jgi:hypothetical protein
MNNIFQKIESLEQYGSKMMLRNSDEKEIKIELMMTLFLENLNSKINMTNKEGARNIEKFSEFLMKLCCEKILTVP